MISKYQYSTMDTVTSMTAIDSDRKLKEVTNIHKTQTQRDIILFGKHNCMDRETTVDSNSRLQKECCKPYSSTLYYQY